MPMKLEGSCQCGGVQFTLDSQTPVPYQLCACSICRKVGGYSGSVNLGGIADSLKIIKGKDLINTMLWLWDHHWPELIHPFASAIDTDLPAPDEMVCVLGNSKPSWVRWPEGKKSVHDVYGDDSIEGWHKKHGLFME
ncbi:hypothetical protein Y699_08287 [Aspergillus fumigatus Z5]|nr:hypothetical protein Y699_08287 [Aspergillus fumigatus Z5]